MRKGNIELRKSTGKNSNFEIVKWEPNIYYGKESDFELVGDFYSKPSSPCCFVHKDCFVNTETCYVVSFVNGGVVSFVGDRAIELESLEEMRDYLFLLRSAVKKSKRYVPRS